MSLYSRTLAGFTANNLHRPFVRPPKFNFDFLLQLVIVEYARCKTRCRLSLNLTSRARCIELRKKSFGSRGWIMIAAYESSGSKTLFSNICIATSYTTRCDVMHSLMLFSGFGFSPKLCDSKNGSLLRRSSVFWKWKDKIYDLSVISVRECIKQGFNQIEWVHVSFWKNRIIIPLIDLIFYRRISTRESNYLI